MTAAGVALTLALSVASSKDPGALATGAAAIGVCLFLVIALLSFYVECPRTLTPVPHAADLRDVIEERRWDAPTVEEWLAREYMMKVHPHNAPIMNHLATATLVQLALLTAEFGTLAVALFALTR